MSMESKPSGAGRDLSVLPIEDHPEFEKIAPAFGLPPFPEKLAWPRVLADDAEGPNQIAASINEGSSIK